MGQVWYGTKEYAQWIADPNVDMDNGKSGYATSGTFLNGGAWVKTSKTSARRITFTWSPRKRSRVQPFLDYADGIYGPGPFYYADPFAMNKNMLPAYWAAPFMNAYDGPLRIGSSRPTLVTGSGITNGYPLESAQFSINTTSTGVPSIFIPIPPGHRAYVGVHGSNLSGTTYPTVRQHTGTTAAAWETLTWMPKTSGPTNWVSQSGRTGITLSFGASVNGSFRFDGAIVQVLPEGSVTPSGGFISGLGTAGLSFAEQPSVSAYSAALDMVGVSAELVETEPWA